MRLFTAVDENILTALGHYKYMTISHLVKIGSGSKSHLSGRLKQLREAGLIGVSQYGGVYKSGGGGRAENIYYLLIRGAKLLAENSTEISIEQIHYPKNIDGIFRNDYFHRISTVHIQIAFEQYANRSGYETLFFDTYFHKIGSAKTAKKDNPLRSLTRITFEDGSFIEPDATCALEKPDGKKQFFCLEVHNGADVSRLVEQVKRIIRAVSKGLITNLYKQTYNINISPRILCTVETENMLRLVQKRMVTDVFFNPDYMKEILLLNVAEKVWETFETGWQNIDGKYFDLSNI